MIVRAGKAARFEAVAARKMMDSPFYGVEKIKAGVPVAPRDVAARFRRGRGEEAGRRHFESGLPRNRRSGNRPKQR
jgi:hypothetical protein